VQQAISGDTGIGARCYVSESAAVFADRLRLGDDSYIAAHAYVTGELPEHLSAEEHIGRLSGLQDPKSGLVPEFGEPLPGADTEGFIGEGAALCHVLCVGYALDRASRA
jgi:hypothetical protein